VRNLVFPKHVAYNLAHSKFMSANPHSMGFEAFKKLIATPELPDLGPGPRASVESIAALNQKLEDYFGAANPRKPTRELLRCAALLWHDHHDAAHVIAQDDSSAEGSFLHGILHRREPDYDNAKYWFRRVGKHPTYSSIAKSVAELGNRSPDQRLASKLISGGLWDPFGFIDACAEAATAPMSDPRTKLLQQIQALELDALLRHLLDRG
jgi:hypothetical protein